MNDFLQKNFENLAGPDLTQIWLNLDFVVSAFSRQFLSDFVSKFQRGFIPRAALILIPVESGALVLGGAPGQKASLKLVFEQF